jgi:FKBP-type peptidyl-prolyl cis-trans isomerase
MATTKKTKIVAGGITNTFLKNALAIANQTEDEKITQEVTTFIEDSIIEIETQIATREVQEIPKAKLDMKRTKAELAKAEAEFEKTRFAVSKDFSSYLTKRNAAKEKVEILSNQLEEDKERIADIEAEVEEFKQILTDFTS